MCAREAMSGVRRAAAVTRVRETRPPQATLTTSVTVATVTGYTSNRCVLGVVAITGCTSNRCVVSVSVTCCTSNRCVVGVASKLYL